MMRYRGMAADSEMTKLDDSMIPPEEELEIYHIGLPKADPTCSLRRPMDASGIRADVSNI